MLRQLILGFSAQGPGFDLTQIKVLDTVALRDVSFRKSEIQNCFLDKLVANSTVCKLHCMASTDRTVLR